MKTALILIATAALVAADGFTGYTYDKPKPTYGAPSLIYSSSGKSSGSYSTNSKPDGFQYLSSQINNFGFPSDGNTGTSFPFQISTLPLPSFPTSGSNGGSVLTSGNIFPSNSFTLPGFISNIQKPISGSESLIKNPFGSGTNSVFSSNSATASGSGLSSSYFGNGKPSGNILYSPGNSQNTYYSQSYNQKPGYQSFNSLDTKFLSTGFEQKPLSYYQTVNNLHNAGISHATGKHQQYYDFVEQGPAQVFKHIYVHAAPEEPEAPATRKQIILPPKQKHYNIIFIKAPETADSATRVIPVPQENEEKTIVYVLVKNPEEIDDVVLPKFMQKLPQKPEVFFIKYDSKDGAHHAIDNIVNDFKGQENVSFNGAEASGSSGVLLNKFGAGKQIWNNNAGGSVGSTNFEITDSSSTNSGISSDLNNAAALASSLETGDGTASYFDSSSSGTSESQSSGSGNTISYDNSGYDSSANNIGLATDNFGSNAQGQSGGSFGSSVTKIETTSSSGTSVPVITSGSITSFNQGQSEGSDGSFKGSLSTTFESNSASKSSIPVITVNSKPGTLMNNYDLTSLISPSQGLPHLTYGVPSFKSIKTA